MNCSFLLRPVEVGALAEEDFGGFHEGFGQSRVRVDGQLEVAGGRGHFDGEDAFRDQLARARASDAHAQHAFGFGIKNQFGDAVAAVEGGSAAGSAPLIIREHFARPIALGLMNCVQNRSSPAAQPRASAALIRSGVMGNCRSRAPVASNTALAINPPIQMTAGSPPP